ncbi:putative mycolyltransferase [Gordonia soli NBRC 108243]|uniref:Putative mycolyltransferase n=1 Tax=Gordonia soli NBRC 108243 TaxID=1223545 RepID=M0QPA1_9ACTN|nr:putative mycolyltransferase [Gordonia soli NBRC 108243]
MTAAAVLAAVMILSVGGPAAMAEPSTTPPKNAAPQQHTPPGPRTDQEANPGEGSPYPVAPKGKQILDLSVPSESMGRSIPIRVLLPADTSKPRPTLYLLNGAGGGEGTGTWFAQTDVVNFFADKNVNVVVPMSGAYSYYTDWQKPDPVLGRNKWTTFLTKELPPVIDKRLNTTKVNGIAGISMAGTSVLGLAESAPDLYRSVASYSGCAETSSPLGQLYIRLVVEGRGGANTTNMWGPYGGPGWRANDPIVQAGKLRGKSLYISSGTGQSGPYDKLDGRDIGGDLNKLVDRVLVGGGIEAATHQCTVNLQNRLRGLGIPATFEYSPGTHTWEYWQDQLHRSWPQIARSLGE